MQAYPSGTRFPGGETLRDVQMRAVAELEAIREAHPDGDAAIVSHADVIKAVVAHYVGLSLDLFQRLVISPASVTIVAFGQPGPRLLNMNDTGHLEWPYELGKPDRVALPAATPDQPKG